ncbi:MAG TPA: MOSC domain-containing protein [Chthoniobacterales bacterium]|jgi:uncharacterized protein YcbX|nr:MOSC domain-containing protein [Chthoniobacterales bacterium]
MNGIGKVDSLWRYPVKSMRGEEMAELFVGYAGVYGDRLFAFRSSTAPAGFPYFTGRDEREMIRYRPRFRYPEKAARPVNLIDAEKNGAAPLSGTPEELMIDVETPEGGVFPIDDPRLKELLANGRQGDLTLIRSERAITDCRPVSVFSIQTAQQIGQEIGHHVDHRRFRANVYLDLPEIGPFAEEQLVGRSLRLGSKVVVAIIQRDSRCMMVTLDPDTAEKNPAVLKTIAQAHTGHAGLYGAVVIEGLVAKGDPVTLLD